MSGKLAFFKDFPDGWIVVIAERNGDQVVVLDANRFPSRPEAQAWATEQIGPSETIYHGPN